MRRLLAKITLVFAVIVFGFFFLADQTLAADVNIDQNWLTPALSLDPRPLKLAKFLRKYDSPLEPYAQTFVEEADKNGLDYRLLVAIAGTESTFGKNYVAGTYNVYGWGVGRIPFSSFEDGIAKVSSGLKENYIDKGASDIEQIGYIYCPPTYLHWSGSVRYFMQQIEVVDISNSGNLLASALPLSL